MRIAVAYNSGDISLGFGHTKEFKIYDVKAGEVLYTEVVETDAEGHIAIAEFLYNLNVDAVITRNIGAAAREMLKIAKISYFAGVTGKSDDAVNRFLKGELVYEQRFENNEESCSGSSCSGCHGC